MTYHVLNGDALVDRFLSAEIDGEVVVARECLVEGNVQGKTIQEVFQTRAEYLSKAYNETGERYYKEVASEFEKLLAAPDHSEFNLWFGYDLFCRANMWFVIWLLQSLPAEKKVYAVYPSYLLPGDIWKDFGSATTSDLQNAFQNRVQLTETDLQLGKELWLAFQSNDFSKLNELSAIETPAFPYLKEVCQAHIERFPANEEKGRPERVLEEIIAMHKSADFYSVYSLFFNREGVYGFGDAQVKQLYDKVMSRYT